MSVVVMVAVLVGAALHASWNALVKGSSDKLLGTALVATGSGLLAACALPFLPLPDRASWPYLATSVVVHIAYFELVAAAYGTGDMSYAYPIMRGSAPLIVAIAGIGLVGEHPSPGGWCGIILVSGGVLGMALARGAPSAASNRSVTGYALGNAVVIAAYTLVDGLGARASGHAVSYTCWLLSLEALAFVLLVSIRRGPGFSRELARGWRIALIGGACTAGAYTLALWAMTQAPIALVASLRETSILFGAALAGLVLKERFGWARHAASATIVCGIAVLRLA